MNRGQVTRQSPLLSRPSKSPPPTLKPIIKSSGGKPVYEPIDSELFNSLMQDHRHKTEDLAKSFKSKKVDIEEELYVEKTRTRLLETEITQLRETLRQSEIKYKRNLELFKNEIQEFKSIQYELMATKEELARKQEELQTLNSEFSRLRDSAKVGYEFVVKCLEDLLLLPDLIQVNSETNELLEFSFDEQKKAKITKLKYVEQQIMKFIEAQEKMIAGLDLEMVVDRIIEECKRKKSSLEADRQKQPSHTGKRPPGQGKMPSKLPKKRSAKKLNDTNEASYQDSLALDAKPNGSLNRSIQSSSGGKNNNYSININLVVNDNSDSAISDQNQSGQGQGIRNFIKFFENELGCNKSEGSFVGAGEETFAFSPKGKQPQRDPSSWPVNDEQDEEEDGRGDSDCSQRLEEADSQGLEEVVAKYEYQISRDTDISMSRGDRIWVYKKSPCGWWYGKNQSTGRVGLFPSNFISPS